MKQSKLIGLTGNSGSGKSTVSRILEDKGVHVIDADKIAHKIYEYKKPAYYEIVGCFSETVLNEDRSINRRKLGKIVFSDKDKLKLLNRITHKYIIEEIKSIIEADEGWYVIDAAVLLESKLRDMVDEIWIIEADREVKRERIIKRDFLSFEEAEKRLNSQMSLSEMKKYSDVVILNNDNDIEHLRQIIEELLFSLETL